MMELYEIIGSIYLSFNFIFIYIIIYLLFDFCLFFIFVCLLTIFIYVLCSGDILLQRASCHSNGGRWSFGCLH